MLKNYIYIWFHIVELNFHTKLHLIKNWIQNWSNWIQLHESRSRIFHREVIPLTCVRMNFVSRKNIFFFTTEQLFFHFKRILNHIFMLLNALASQSKLIEILPHTSNSIKMRMEALYLQIGYCIADSMLTITDSHIVPRSNNALVYFVWMKSALEIFDHRICTLATIQQICTYTFTRCWSRIFDNTVASYREKKINISDSLAR